MCVMRVVDMCVIDRYVCDVCVIDRYVCDMCVVDRYVCGVCVRWICMGYVCDVCAREPFLIIVDVCGVWLPCV